jgi:autotransporter-associated beta strand protein
LTSNAGATAVTFTNPLQFNNTATATLTVNGAGAATFNGVVSGNGTINILSDTTGRAIDFNGSVSTFGGQMIVRGVESVRLSSVSFSGAATYNLAAAATLSTSAGIATGPVTLPIGALSGVANSTLMGTGNVGTGGSITYQIGDANANTIFAGNVINGINGATPRTVSIIKSGTGMQTLSGSNGYTGTTQVNSGTLVLAGANAWNPALTGAAGTILNGGRLVFNYTGGSSPGPTIKTILTGEAAGNFLTGQIRTTNAADGRHGIGWIDNGSTTVTTGYTYLGDANVDGVVNTSDFTLLSQNFGSTGAVWGKADFNYDGVVNALDFNAIATNFGATAIPSQPLLAPGLLGSLVPEPSLLSLAGAALLIDRRRSRAAGKRVV